MPDPTRHTPQHTVRPSHVDDLTVIFLGGAFSLYYLPQLLKRRHAIGEIWDTFSDCKQRIDIAKNFFCKKSKKDFVIRVN